MNILYFLVGCSVLMALIFLAAFVWSLKNGQHDDVVPVADSMEFARTHPNVELDIVDSDHELGNVLEHMAHGTLAFLGAA